MAGPSTDPKGFDRSKALPIKPTGTAKSPVYTVYSPNGKILGAFGDPTSDASKAKKAAENFRDGLPLEVIFPNT